MSIQPIFNRSSIKYNLTRRVLTACATQRSAIGPAFLVSTLTSYETVRRGRREIGAVPQVANQMATCNRSNRIAV
jgi:hypothetical protein